MKKQHKNIRDELAYFYKVIKNMDKKDFIKQSKINEYERSLDEILDNQFPIDENMDKYLEEQNLLGWIELIENPELYEAVKSLSIEDQVLLSYIIKEGRTQRELEIIYELTQQGISRKFNKIIFYINKFLDKS